MEITKKAPPQYFETLTINALTFGERLIVLE